MMTKRCHRKFLVIVCTGGCLFQLAGCIGGFAPILASYAESTILSNLLALLLF